MDPREKKLAKLLVNYSVNVQKNELVMVQGDHLAIPILTEIYKEVVNAGAHPILNVLVKDTDEIMYKNGSKEQLEWVSPITKWQYENIDVAINIRGEENTRALTNVDPEKQKLAALAKVELRETFFKRAAVKDLRWTLARIPTQAYAQDADMSFTDYEDFLYGATFCDKENPVEEWQKLHTEQQKVIDWLYGKKLVTIKSPNADFSVSIEDRTFVNESGKLNMPSGEVYTGPIENSAEGWVNFTYPAIRLGREVEGVKLAFKEGKVIKASASKNEEYLLSQLNSDEGASYLGEFAIGTNYGIQQFTKSILFDEKIGGSFHMAVGNGYPETGSKNKSSIHWDFICDIREDSEIRVDGDLLYKDGQFQI
jgi:aminopeptidase